MNIEQTISNHLSVSNRTPINLTPHAISYAVEVGADEPHMIEGQDGRKFWVTMEVKPSGKVARVSTYDLPVSDDVLAEQGLSGLQVVTTRSGNIIDLPEESPDTMFIVSGMIIDALRASGISRPDVLAPNTGATAVRNDKGHVVAVTSFRR